MSYNLESKVQKGLAGKEKTFIVDNNCNVVCPWIIRNGATNLTEQGSVDNTQDPDNFGFFQKVFTGNECITATWEDSTKLVKPSGVNAYDYQFQVGTYHLGAVVVGTGEYASEIESMESMEDFLSMKTSAEVVIRFESWIPTNADLFKLYTIPDLYGKKWYYISNVKILNDLQFPKDQEYMSVPAVEVTFTSLVDKLQNTGRAVEQFVQYGAIGEPYTYPWVQNTESTAETGGYTELTKEVKNIVQTPKHSRYLQMELFGANALGGIQIVGRKITQNSDGTYRTSPWKFFVPIGFYNGRANDINKTSLATKNFYYFPDETLVYRFSQDLWTAIKNTNDAIATNHNAGQLSMGASSSWTDLPNGLHSSNPLQTDPNMHYDYNDPSWHPISTAYTRSANGCYYCADTLSYGTSDTMMSILTKNGFLYSTQEVLPLGFYSSKPYKISNLPILGGVISKWAGDWTIDSRTKQRKPLSIGYFMDCDVAGMCANIFNSSAQSTTVWCPTLALASGEKAPKWLGTTACNTTLLMELTDIVDTNKDTILFGQSKYEDGTWINSDHSTYLYNGQDPVYDLPTSSNQFWFVIDNIDIYALHNGSIKVTAFETIQNDMKPIWQTTVKSKANWTESIRDWETSIKTGCWSDNWCSRTDEFTWPTNPTKPINPIVYTPTLYEDNTDTTMYTKTTESLYILPINSQTGFNNLWDRDEWKQIRRQNYNQKTQSFLYTDLGISGVTNKTTFLNTIKSLKFNTKYYAYILQATSTIANENGNYSFEINVSESGNNFNFIPISVGHRNWVPTPHKTIEKDLQMWVNTGPRANYWNGGIFLEGNINVTLNDETIVFSIADNTNFWVDTSETITTTTNLLMLSNSSYMYLDKQIKYSFGIETIEFIKN